MFCIQAVQTKSHSPRRAEHVAILLLRWSGVAEIRNATANLTVHDDTPTTATVRSTVQIAQASEDLPLQTLDTRFR